MKIAAVVLDGGETLFDETRTWSIWADWVGVPPFTLFVALGGVLQQGKPFHEVFRLFRPDFDLDRELGRRAEAGVPHTFLPEDLYADVRPAIQALAGAGYAVFVAGNMTEAGEQAIRKIGLDVRDVLSSARLKARSSESKFFRALADLLGVGVEEIAYVTHRPDTNVPAAVAAGVRTVFLRRGPIAYLGLGSSSAPGDRETIGSLAELPGVLAAWEGH